MVSIPNFIVNNKTLQISKQIINILNFIRNNRNFKFPKQIIRTQIFKCISL